MDDVTAFQPARPPLSMSNDAICRAVAKGWLWEVNIVPTRPMWRVQEATAERMVMGSKWSMSKGVEPDVT